MQRLQIKGVPTISGQPGVRGPGQARQAGAGGRDSGALLAPPSLGYGPFRRVQDSSHHVHFLSTGMEEEEKGQEEHDVLLPGTSTLYHIVQNFFT